MKPLVPFEEIHNVAVERKAQIRAEMAEQEMLQRVLDEVDSILIENYQWDHPDALEPIDLTSWKYIDDTTILLIGDFLKTRQPFNKFTWQWSGVTVSKLQWLSRDEKEKIWDLLKQTQLKIMNWNTEISILWDEMLQVWDNMMTLRQYIYGDHQIGMKEIWQ